MFYRVGIYFYFIFIVMFSVFLAKAMEDTRIKESIKKKKSSITQSFRVLKKKHKEDKHEKLYPQKELKEKTLLYSQNEHMNLLKSALRTADTRVVISSPDISPSFIGKEFIDWVNASKNNLEITIYTSMEGADSYLKGKAQSKKKIKLIKPIDLRITNNCNASILVMDDLLFTNGSYAWLSCAGALCFSSIVRGKEAENLIKSSLEALERSLQDDKDLSFVLAEKTRLLELREDMIPRDGKESINSPQEDLSLLTAETASGIQREQNDINREESAQKLSDEQSL